MNYLADASSTIDLLNDPARFVIPPTQLFTDGLALSIFSYMEVLDGVYTSRDPKHAQAQFRQFLRGVSVLPFSRTVAQRAARLRGQMRAQKLQLDHRAIDILIAATALTYDLTTLTSDSDYDDIPGLTTLNPRTGRLVTH